jgi:hypothetical protein
VWSRAGIICTGETYQNVVKMTDFRECEKINEKALKALVRAAVTLNKTTYRAR